MIKKIKEIISYSDMINSLVKRELRGKYKGSIIGFFWTFINPLCQIVIYSIVFSVIVRSNIDKFYAYVITGMIPWLFFDMSLRIGAGCVRYQGDLIKKIYFPREVLPISCVTANFVNMLFCFIIVFITLAASGIGFEWRCLVCLPLVMMLEYMMTLGFTLFVSAITVYFRDMEHIVTVILMAWIYLTPILYSLESIPGRKLIWIFKLNPMTSIIDSYHRILFWHSLPSVKLLVYAAGVSVIMLVVGELVFVKLDNNFAEEL